MKKLIKTIAFTLTLSLGIWTLAVTFSPISSNFQTGAEVSASAFNDLFSAINENFNEVKTVIENLESAVLSNQSDLAGNAEAIEGLKLVPMAKLNNSSEQSILNSQAATLTWDQVMFDSADFYTAQNPSVVTIPEDGVYQINASIKWLDRSGPSDGLRSLTILKTVGSGGPSLALGTDFRNVSLSQINTSQVSGLFALQAGDAISVNVSQSSGGSLVAAFGDDVGFSIHKVSSLP